MNPEEKTTPPAPAEPTTVAVPPPDVLPPEILQPEPTAPHRSHTIDDDVSKAMNTTDAEVVQEMLITARQREADEKQFKKVSVQRKWYSTFSIIFITLALVGFGYAVYHYKKLTVEIEKGYSVGVFPSTPPVTIDTTDIRQTIELLEGANYSEGKPLLVPLVKDAESLLPISREEFFTFIEARPTEPFVASIETIRLGIMNGGNAQSPFLILSVADPQIASKEFLIAEDTLLQLFYRALGIDLADYVSEVGREFESAYIYNLPVRKLIEIDPETKESTTVLLYGYATSNIIVVTTKPEVLKAVYDTIIRQR